MRKRVESEEEDKEEDKDWEFVETKSSRQAKADYFMAKRKGGEVHQ